MELGLKPATFQGHPEAVMAQRQLSEETGAQAMHDMHVYGVITIGLELCLCLENFLPILVVCCWKRSRERTVGDKLLACLSATYILSALVPTPLGLVSYFHGSWYGGAATCECFQVTCDINGKDVDGDDDDDDNADDDDNGDG